MTTKLCLVALAVAAFAAGAGAQTTLTASQTDNTLIPDADLSGVAETISLGASIQSISSVQLTLEVGATLNGAEPFNGDYYAYLTHGSSQAVLLNRVGVTGSNPFGYADAGLDATFSDAGSDIHNYQDAGYTLNGNGQLTGTWAPDGRTASPLTVLDTDPRTAFLSVFDGGNSGGAWTLFIADCSPGGMGNLDGWTLRVTGAPAASPGVPDGGSTRSLLAFAFGLLLLTRPFRQNRRAPSVL